MRFLMCAPFLIGEAVRGGISAWGKMQAVFIAEAINKINILKYI